MRNLQLLALIFTLSFELILFCEKSNAGKEDHVSITVSAAGSADTRSDEVADTQDIHDLISEFGHDVDRLRSHLRLETEAEASRSNCLKITEIVGKMAAIAGSAYVGMMYISIPLSEGAFRSIQIAYDTAAGCGPELPSWLSGETPVCLQSGTSELLCQPTLRTSLTIFSALAPAFFLHRNVLEPAVRFMIDMSDYALKKAIFAYVRLQDYLKKDHSDGVVEPILSKGARLIARQTELKRLPEEYRRFVFRKASESGQIPLMLATLDDSSESEAATRAELSRTTEDVCSICLSEFDGSLPLPVVKRACGHVFHENCLSLWARTSCPLCRDRANTRLVGLHETWPVTEAAAPALPSP